MRKTKTKFPWFSTFLIVLSLCSSSEARRSTRGTPAREAQVLRHRFGSAGAGEVTLRLEALRGRLLRGPLGRSRLVDLADYSHAGVLTTTCELRLGPRASGPVRVPPGTYEVSFSSDGPEGLPTLGLLSEEGLSLRLVLPRASRPAEKSRILHAESLAADGAASWPLVVHLPTVSALLVLVPAPDGQKLRRRTRVQSIHEALQERALRSGDIEAMQRLEGSEVER